MPRIEDIDTDRIIELSEVHNGATALRFVKQNVPNLVMLTWFGSHLYGTHTIESDLDFKGVYMIPEKELILGDFTKSIKFSTKKPSDGSKNQSTDIDIEIYSLHYFLELLAKGETVALDMLHSPKGYPYGLIHFTPVWNNIWMARRKFYTKSMKAFVGYARKQAAKYGIKGSRLNDLKNAIARLKGRDESLRLVEIWGQLYIGEHVYREHDLGNYFYQVLGRKFQDTTTVGYVLPILERILSEYGDRAHLAEKNEGVDWKAMSHALRAAYSVYDILQFGKMTLPRFEAAYLLAVKKGAMDFKVVSAELEKMMDILEKLSEKVDYPSKVNPKMIRDITLKAYGWDI